MKEKNRVKSDALMIASEGISIIKWQFQWLH